MVHKCVVRDCRSKWYPGCRISFHLFPKDVSRRNNWLTVVPLKTKWYDNARICSLHFRETDYDATSKRLKQTALPVYNYYEEISHMTEQSTSSDASLVNQSVVPCAGSRLDLSILPSSPALSCSQQREASVKPLSEMPGPSTSTEFGQSIALSSCNPEKTFDSANCEDIKQQTIVPVLPKIPELLSDVPGTSSSFKNYSHQYNKNIEKLVSCHVLSSSPTLSCSKKHDASIILASEIAGQSTNTEFGLSIATSSSDSVKTCGSAFYEDLRRQTVISASSEKRVPPLDLPGFYDPPLQEGILRDTVNVQGENTSTAKLLCDKSLQVKLKTEKENVLQKQNKALKQKVRRQNMSIDNMKSLLNIVKKFTNQSEIENIITGRFSDICKHFKKTPTNPQGMRYSDEVKSFALTLHFYSPKTYEFLRSLISLPHVQTIRRSLALFDCNVGFISEVLNYLKEQVKLPEKHHLKNVALIFDGMSLKEDLAYDSKSDKVFGYVDLGPITVDDPEKLASEALVFQIVSYTYNFKCPIAYFFIEKCLPGKLLSELINTAIMLLHEIGITVRSLTCDGASSNIKAYEHLGCNLSENDLRPYFQHPNGHSNIYCLLDAAHMLKLARNALADFNLQSETGEISFQYVKKLHAVQEDEGLKFSNKLSGSHVNFKNKKMNVKLAAQVMSSSVADAIDFLRVSGNPPFKNSEATVEFLQIMDRLFDLMNSKSPFGSGYKSPLSLKNKSYRERIFKESKDYLKSLMINGINILKHPRKMFALGFLINITSLNLLVTDLCTMEVDPLKYLLTFKCSQDNLEFFFSCIRARGRAQDNPSPLEFRYIMRKMLFRNSIRPSVNANCIDNGFEMSHILEFNEKPKDLLQHPKEAESLETLDEIYRCLETIQTSLYQENILYYITGYIVKHMLAHLSCKYCHDLLISADNSENDHFYCLNLNKFQSFTTFLNRGKLYFPSVAAYSIVKYADKVFKRAASMGQLRVDNIQNKLLNIVQQYFAPLVRQMFDHPAADSITCSDLHELKIVKEIANSFLKLRLRTALKKPV